MTSPKILRASVFILAFIIGMLRESIASGAESWRLAHETASLCQDPLQNIHPR